MSAHYSKFCLNTYAATPYFESQLPEGYPLHRVLQKCRSFRRLPPNLRQLAGLAKKWTELHPSTDPFAESVDSWYDAEGYELDPSDGRRFKWWEVDAQWQPDPSLDGFVPPDVPLPEGGFADPETWDEPGKTTAAEGGPTDAQLLADVASRDREAVAEEYGIPIEELPGVEVHVAHGPA